MYPDMDHEDTLGLNRDETEALPEIPAIPQTPPDTRVIPAINPLAKSAAPKPSSEEANEAAIEPEIENEMMANAFMGQTLPVAGPEDDKLPSSRFPIMLFLAFLIMGSSAVLALKKQE